jgi:hypothetical protein
MRIPRTHAACVSRGSPLVVACCAGVRPWCDLGNGASLADARETSGPAGGQDRKIVRRIRKGACRCRDGVTLLFLSVIAPRTRSAQAGRREARAPQRSRPCGHFLGQPQPSLLPCSARSRRARSSGFAAIRHCSNDIAYMSFLLGEKSRLARPYAERRQEGVLVRERIPAQSGEVEDEPLR